MRRNKRRMLASLVLLTAGATVAEAAVTECDTIKAALQTRIAPIVKQVSAKDQTLVSKFTTALDGIKRQTIPTAAEVMKAVNATRPDCVASIGEADCNRFRAEISAALNKSAALLTRYGNLRCASLE